MIAIATATTTAKATARAVRIWIEGAKLTAAGFTPDTAYVINLWIMRADALVLMVDANGDRRVTKATRNGKARPIIDLHSKDVAAMFPAGTKVRVEYHPNQIIFTKES